MAFTHRQPILFDNSREDEPYIPLPSPHEYLRLTPWRMEDIDPAVPILNHPAVYPNLVGPPYPYLREHAESWTTAQLKRLEGDRQYFTGNPDAPIKEGKIFDYTPMCVIREVKEDGSQTFIGVADMGRSQFIYVTDVEKKERLIAENKAKPLGDPSIIYMVGDYLAPSHHSRAIMTAVIRELIRSWAIPYMRLRELSTTVIEGNIGSRRVFEKLGFRYVEFAEGSVPTQGKREKVTGEWVFHLVVEA